MKAKPHPKDKINMAATLKTQILNPASPWLRRIVIAGLVWAMILCVLMGAQRGASPEDRTIALSIILSGGYTLLLYWTRSRWLPWLANRPLRKAIILGSLNAAVIETLFLVVEKIMGASGVAAHPNLAMDLLLTMPWYIGMVVIFVRVQHIRRFSPWIVLLLGGLYEIGADGMVGGGFSGEMFTPAFWLMLPTLYWWLFIPVYSSMVLPPAWIIKMADPSLMPAHSDERKTRFQRVRAAYKRWITPQPSGPAWRDALRPLLWLIPFVCYLVIFLIVAGVLSEII
jgi:hypothetical protein